MLAIVSAAGQLPRVSPARSDSVVLTTALRRQFNDELTFGSSAPERFKSTLITNVADRSGDRSGGSCQIGENSSRS